MFFAPDWIETGTDKQIEKKIGGGFKVRYGWQITSSDTVFCDCRAGIWTVSCWNDPNAREKIGDAIKMLFSAPVHDLR